MATKFIQIEAGVVRSIFNPPAMHIGKPLAELLTPELAATFEEVQAEVEVQAGWLVLEEEVDDGAAPQAKGKAAAKAAKVKRRVFRRPPPAEVEAPPRIRRISPLAFRRRLDAGTREAITLAASRHMEAGSAAVQVFLDDLSSAGFVDLDLGETIAGVAALRDLGLITDEQQAAMLADGSPAEAV
jgi:hypothetical protein